MTRVFFYLLVSSFLAGYTLVIASEGGDATNPEAAPAEATPVAEVVEQTDAPAPEPTEPPAEPTTTMAPTEAPVKEEKEAEVKPEPVFTSAEQDVETVEEEVKEPPNEWSTYYSLPSEMPDMLDLFNQVFENYVNSANPETECQENDAEFNRWYKSSQNSDHVLLSYYCKTKSVRGYEHLKVSVDKKNVIEFHGSLKGFKIMDAGDYESKLEEDEAVEIRNHLLPSLIEQIAAQRDDTAAQDEICPDPGTETYASAQQKYENALYYYKIIISCNKTATDSGLPSHRTEIEVVEDSDFKVLKGGEPVLVSMQTNIDRNTMYIEKKEQEAAEEEASMKQTDASSVFVPSFTSFVSLVAIYLLPRLLWEWELALTLLRN